MRSEEGIKEIAEDQIEILHLKQIYHLRENDLVWLCCGSCKWQHGDKI